MFDNTTPTELLESSLPGAWIAEHRRIWQMNFLNARELARFCHDRGLADIGEKGIIQLWQMGLLKADLVESDEELIYDGLVDRGVNRYGSHIYSDERILHQYPNSWGDALKTLISLQENVELLFHPFRYYVLYHLDRVLRIHIHKMQMFNQEHVHELLNLNLSMFNNWSSSEQFIPRIRLWNDIASLGIVTEPCEFVRVFHYIKFDPAELENYQEGEAEIREHIAHYWNSVNNLYHRIGMELLEEIPQELCIATQTLDPNRWIHTLLCLGDSKFRMETEGRLGGALFLRTMAEMLRRATEKAFDTKLREEDELGFGWMPKDVKETLYGSNRLLDDHRAAGVFARRHGYNYKSRVHLYCEGNTEYGALTSFFKTIGIFVPTMNLHGLINSGGSMVKSFSDSLKSDIQDHVFSMVIIDGDVRENVRMLESAARHNQTSDTDGLFGRFFLSYPDFEIANFELEELEEVFWNWVGGERPSQADRELLHNHVKAAKNSTEFFKGVKRAALSLERLYGYDKCEAWGAELMKYAWENQSKGGRERQIIEAMKLALHWETTLSLERYESAIKGNMVDPQTGEIVKRTTSSHNY